MAYKEIDDYGIIGNLYTVALVGLDGSIDWFCPPHFDSPSVFAAILDEHKGGWFKISPAEECRNQQFYYPETNVLITRYLHPDGVGEVIDFMPVADNLAKQESHQIIRQVTCVRGTTRFELDCSPAFDYARAAHVTRITPQGAEFTAEAMFMGLIAPVELEVGLRQEVKAGFTLTEGETLTFALYYRVDGKPCNPPAVNGEQAFQETVNFWQKWIAQCTYSGRWREMVHRSALTLKLLTYAPTGAMVASPTTSLPEEIGGGRNWDYRYTWIRDTSFSMYAFLRIGFTQEAEKFMEWISARAHESYAEGTLQIMYGIHGNHELPESTLDHLEGYKSSRPVRIGNGAAHQLQLDIYGELMDAVYLYNKHGVAISYDLWMCLRPLLNWVCDNWKRQDEGIWEVRGGAKHFVYSKMMCWVALDRGLRLAEKRSFPADRERWTRVRDEIYTDVMHNGWNRELGYFRQHYDSDSLDASNLLMPLVFFVSPRDPRMLSTLDQTLKVLVSDSLVLRYRVDHGEDDGLTGKEGTFTLCTFWLVEALTLAGRVQEARLIFEKMLSYSNHLGLYSEEIAYTGEQIGNFPQAFSHLSLISAALKLDRALDNKNKP
ncbi:MAG: glycoside hydrolase family 15 protein [Deltaproteobacteria bacterium]|nr:glycoside hydrolase family 15 protein [Deltaproteobacteria bacterium]